ncbi:E3 SUMO-protein ligase ZBED1-like [Tachysurus ichikawai]
MASGGEVRLQYEEAPASFKSVVWRHFGFAVEYIAEEEKTHTYPTGSGRHMKITKAVGVFIAKDLQLFSVIGDAGFCHLIKTLDPRYRLPSRTFFSTEIIPDLYEKTCNSIVYKLAQAQSLALTTDGWTSRATVSYLTVTVHYMSDWEMNHCCE